ncbi:uncharacterized protein LOC103708086 isoform X2 [Phoenix dactylifera]|uniref:Uncharacterized protein LOC103708086 isoform X2 n=1 Tax=Phoenix dactylifera TaxID=42345 RepID=A0A8B9ARE2_PHODC|nr:uncharacterized protein LOC103708086 isoform X2 [Phoenix dactylifera]
MGCTSSIPISCIVGRRRRKKPSSIHEVAVFVPALRIPLAVDLVRPLRGLVSRDVLDKLSTLRGRIVSLAEESYLAAVPTVSELERALEEYVPVLLGLTKKEHRLEASVEFKWKSLGDDDQETCFASAWYELLSVVHMMAMLSLLEANLMLVPKDSMDECGKVVSEDAKKVAVDLLLKAAGCLDYCVRHILVQLPMQIRKSLPSSLQEGMLEAISVQALAQSVEMQLGLALECEKATLSVKRRLACEAVSYFSQVHYCMAGCDTSDAYGKKLLLFIKWKYLEAKAAAYYYHGLVLDKGNGSSNHLNAVCCLFVAEELLTDSKRACLSFCLAAPVTRVPPAWGVMKHLRKKIPEVASKKSQMYGYPIEQDKNGAFQSLPDLPEFPLSLKPDDYELPNIDPSWESKDCQPQIQSLKAHLKDEEDDEMGTE